MGGAFFVAGILTMGFNIAMTIIGAKREQAAVEASTAAASA
jgi:cbb3-type cytochrome oxidase subunit 1